MDLKNLKESVRGKTIAQLVAGAINVLDEKARNANMDNVRTICFHNALAFLVLLGATCIITSAFFLLNMSVNGIYAAFALAIFALLYKNEHKGISSIIFFALIITSLLLASIFYDSSWDGRAYHQIGVLYFYNDWNPVYQKMAELDSIKDFLSHEIWVETYMKFSELFAACVWKALGFSIGGVRFGIESGKVVNYFAIFAVFFYAVNVLSKLKFINSLYVFLLAIFIAFSPISFLQINIYYVDGLLDSFLCLVFLAIVDLEIKSNKIKYAIFILALACMATVKLTGLAYAGFIGLFYLAYKIIFFGLKDSRGIFLSGIVVAVLIVILNANPLLTNIKDGKHPGHPLMGDKKVDIITGHLPQNFKGMNRFEKLFHTTFSKTTGSRENTELKIPFIKNKGEWYSGRVGGFGIYFGGMVILSVIFLIRRFENLRKKEFIALLTLIFCSVAINPESWWVRYAPQFYLIPIVCLCASLYLCQKPFKSVYRVLMVIFLTLNICSFVEPVIDNTKKYTKSVDVRMENLQQVVQKDSKIYIAYLDRWSSETSFTHKLRVYGFSNVEVINKQKMEELKSQGIEFYRIPDLISPEAFWNVNLNSAK